MNANENQKLNDEAQGVAGIGCTDLLGCPWCGVLPEYQPRAQGHTDERGHTYHWPHQVVHDCKVLGHQICVRAREAGLPDTKESVFSIWNKRAAGQPNDGR